MSNEKAINHFRLQATGREIKENAFFIMSTTKRESLTPPDGVLVYDSDLNQLFIGNGAVRGGVSAGRFKSTRTIDADAASAFTVDTSTDTVTWSQGGQLKTGDAVTVADGGGTLPAGLSNGTTYYVIKDNDNDSTTNFELATNRANALAGTAVDITDTGSVGFTMVISDVYLQDDDDVLYVDADVAVDVYLPDATTADNRQYTVKRKTGGAVSVTVKSAGGTVDEVAAATGLVLKASTKDYATAVSDGTNWIGVSYQITTP